MAKLTGKQRMFIKEYLVDLNATGAALRSGYSKKTAYAVGFENLRKPKIAEGIQEEMDKRALEVHITAEDVLKDIIDTRLQCQGKMSYIDAQGNQRMDTAAVNGRMKANELLGKHLVMFTDKIEHSGEMTVNNELIEKYLKS